MSFIMVGRDGFVKPRRENRPQDAFLILLFESIFLWETKKVIFFSEYYLFLGGQRWIRTIVPLREQIYSLPPLATRPSAQLLTILYNKWCTLKDSNLGPTGYEPVALTNWAKGALIEQNYDIIFSHFCQ